MLRPEEGQLGAGARCCIDEIEPFDGDGHEAAMSSRDMTQGVSGS